MGTINVYNTLNAKHEEITANGRLKDIFPDINFSHSLCLKAGNRIDGSYIVQPDDVLYVRKVPKAATTIAIIAITTAVVALGVGVGVAIYADQKSKEAQEEMEKAQRNAQNLAQQVQQLPFVRGAKNKKALGNPVQFVMGSVYNTPYNLTDGFFSIQNGSESGEDGIFSFYNAAFSAGYGSQKITEMRIGNERIASNANGISGEQNFDSDSLYYDSRQANKVEVRQPGVNMTLPGFNQKVSSTYAGSEVKHEFGQDAEPVIVQAADNAMKIQVCIQFNSLRQYNTEAEAWEARSVTVNPYWSNDGGNTWHLFYFTENNVITRNVNHTIRFVAEKTFTAAESYGKTISIKLEKATPKMEKNSQEDCMLLWYQTFCYDAAKSSANSLVACSLVEEELFNKCTRVGYRIVANDNTEGILDELHCMSQGYARTWDGTDWSESKTPTRNIASWILEILTSSVHEPSKFDMDEIDLASFGALYDYCDTEGFNCDGILTESISKKNLIEKLLSICNSTLIINQEGLLEVCIDKEETTPVALLNAENIASMTYSKSMQRKPDGMKITFTNRYSWQIDTFYSMLDGGSYDYQSDTVVEAALDYITEYNHAYKIAQRKLRQSQLQPREIKVDVGSEGDYYPLYSTVLLQVPQLLQGLRSSIISSITYNDQNQITKITIQDVVEFDENERYGVIIQGTNDYGFALFSAEVEGDLGEDETQTRSLIFTTPLTVSSYHAKPEIGNHLSFGLLDNGGHFTKITNTMKIYGIEPNQNGGMSLTLKDYNEAIYQYGTIPTYKTNLTKPQANNRNATLNDLNRLREQINTLQNELVELYGAVAPVDVSADVLNAVVNTDENGRAVLPQRIETTITVKQGLEDRDFSIGEINLPAGWEYEVIGHKIIFFIRQGNIVKPGRFKIPVYYSPVVAYEQYEDEEGNEYQDQNSNNYIDQQISSTPYSYDLWFTYYTFAEGAFLGPISAVEDIPALLSINDYFVWSGSQTESSLSITGEFLPGRLYKFIGTAKEWQWEEDTDIGHNNIAMGDILNIAQADLQKNNSRAYAYLDHLTANQVFADRLVASQAFIEKLSADEGFFNKLFANEITVSNPGVIKSENFVEGGAEGFKISSDGIIEAYEGRFAGGLGNLEKVDGSYRSWLPFVNGLVIISLESVGNFGNYNLGSYKTIAVVMISSHFANYAEHGYLVNRAEMEMISLYQASGCTFTYDTEQTSSFVSRTIRGGYKITGIPGFVYTGSQRICFNILSI